MKTHSSIVQEGPINIRCSPSYSQQVARLRKELYTAYRKEHAHKYWFIRLWHYVGMRFALYKAINAISSNRKLYFT